MLRALRCSPRSTRGWRCRCWRSASLRGCSICPRSAGRRRCNAPDLRTGGCMRSSAARCSRAWMDPAMSNRHVVQQKACCAINTLVAAIHMHVECLFKVRHAWNSSCLLDIKHSCEQGCALAFSCNYSTNGLRESGGAQSSWQLHQLP